MCWATCRERKDTTRFTLQQCQILEEETTVGSDTPSYSNAAAVSGCVQDLVDHGSRLTSKTTALPLSVVSTMIVLSYMPRAFRAAVTFLIPAAETESRLAQ